MPRSVSANPARHGEVMKLTENITVQLQGSVKGGPVLDLAMTGIGPIFRGDVVAGDSAAIVTHSYTVNPTETGYRVEYSIGLRIKVEHQAEGMPTSVEYRDVIVTGTALAEEGKKLVIAKNGDHELTLTLGKAAAK